MTEITTTEVITPINANEQLVSFISRIEKLEEDKKQISLDIREVLSEAKSFGYEPKIIKKIIKIRKLTDVERQTEIAMLETYLTALGMDMEALGAIAS